MQVMAKEDDKIKNPPTDTIPPVKKVVTPKGHDGKTCTCLICRTERGKTNPSAPAAGASPSSPGGQASDKPTGKAPDANRCQHGNVVGRCPTCAIGLDKKSEPATSGGESSRVPGKPPGWSGPKPDVKIPSSVVVTITNIAVPDNSIPTTGAGQGSHSFTVSAAGDYIVKVEQQPANTKLTAGRKPLKGWKVILAKTSGTVIDNKLTNQSGEVKFVKLAPGDYTVTLRDLTLPAQPAQPHGGPNGQ